MSAVHEDASDRLAPMVPRDISIAETQEARGVVVEDVALLRRGKERRLLDSAHGSVDQPWPDQESEPNITRSP